MSTRFASVFAAALLCAGSGSALAQTEAPKPPSDNVISSVTVTAAPPPKTIEKQAHAFVQSYAAAQHPELDQIARWYDPVCVQVVGLPSDDEAAKIKARIESVARALNTPAPRAKCTANVEIVFTPYPQATMDAVARRREYFLGYFHVHNRDRLKAVTHPIQSWYVTATRGRASGSVALTFSMFSGSNQRQTEVIDDPNNQMPNGCGDSRLTTSCLQSGLHNIFIVADSKALEGQDLGLVADYMAMLALSQPRSLDGCNALPSVIDAFAKPACAGRDPPDGLTPADAAYLTALYDADLMAKRKIEQTEIAGRMARILANSSAGGKSSGG